MEPAYSVWIFDIAMLRNTILTIESPLTLWNLSPYILIIQIYLSSQIIYAMFYIGIFPNVFDRLVWTFCLRTMWSTYFISSVIDVKHTNFKSNVSRLCNYFCKITNLYHTVYGTDSCDDIFLYAHHILFGYSWKWWSLQCMSLWCFKIYWIWSPLIKGAKLKRPKIDHR